MVSVESGVVEFELQPMQRNVWSIQVGFELNEVAQWVNTEYLHLLLFLRLGSTKICNYTRGGGGWIGGTLLVLLSLGHGTCPMLNGEE